MLRWDPGLGQWARGNGRAKWKGGKGWGWRERESGRTQLVRLSRSAIICAAERVGVRIEAVVDMMCDYIDMPILYADTVCLT